MPRRATPLLHRDDPARPPLTGHVKVTREDWLNLARDVLVSHGMAELKVLSLSRKLQVSRSSFYWYFKDRNDLLEALLEDWEARNTRSIAQQCTLPASGITEAVCNFFRCFLDPGLFDQGLDFAVREWSRRDAGIRKRIDEADRTRLAAIAEMFARHGYSDYEADVRARILYFMQLGYHALEVREPMEERTKRLQGYVKGFIGQEPDRDVVKRFAALAMSDAWQN